MLTWSKFREREALKCKQVLLKIKKKTWGIEAISVVGKHRNQSPLQNQQKLTKIMESFTVVAFLASFQNGTAYLNPLCRNGSVSKVELLKVTG
jgi:hypothetical protein